MPYLQCIFDLRFNRGFVLFTDLDYRVIVTFIHQHLGLNLAIVYACSKLVRPLWQFVWGINIPYGDFVINCTRRFQIF